MGFGISGAGRAHLDDTRSSQPGLWDRLSSGFQSFREQATDCTAGLLSGLGPVDLPAPYQNDQTRALCKALGAGAGLAGDAALGAAGLAEIGGGGALSLSGVGAVAGVPLSAAGVAQVGVAAAGSVVHANNLGNAISEMRSAENRGGSGSGRTGGNQGTSSGGGPNGTYELNPKHGTVDRGQASRAPTNGQAALDNSHRIKETSTRRVGVDPKTKEFVVFDEHLGGKFHGHVRAWEDLTSEMQNTLRRAGLVNGRGKPL
ncbi:hypothetical protein L6R52_33435 [Myxococcota bacterium]|nr:hypothetical protein [Myxococcota bacterium]